MSCDHPFVCHQTNPKITHRRKPQGYASRVASVHPRHNTHLIYLCNSRCSSVAPIPTSYSPHRCSFISPHVSSHILPQLSPPLFPQFWLLFSPSTSPEPPPPTRLARSTQACLFCTRRLFRFNRCTRSGDAALRVDESEGFTCRALPDLAGRCHHRSSFEHNQILHLSVAKTRVLV